VSKQEKSMPFSEDDKTLIKNLHLFEGYGPQGLLAGFSMKNWMKGSLDTLLKKLKKMEAPTESVAAADRKWRVCLLQNLPITET